MIGKIESIFELTGSEDLRKLQKKKAGKPSEKPKVPQRIVDEQVQGTENTYDSNGRENIRPGIYVNRLT